MALTEARRRTIRTVFAVVVGAAAGMPLLVHTAGIPDTVPGLGVVLAVSGSVTRLLALPLVDSWLPSWLKKEPDPDAEVMRQATRE